MLARAIKVPESRVIAIVKEREEPRWGNLLALGPILPHDAGVPDEFSEIL
jgi:hypothetical protein